MVIVTCNGIKKSFNDKLLFENVAFGLEKGDKIGIIGKNGAGKTTLMKIIAGFEVPDAGEVVFNNNVKFEYLDQMPDFSDNTSTLDYTLRSNSELYSLLERYHYICDFNIKDKDEELQEITHRIDELKGWNYENETKKILSQLGIQDFNKKINELSGGLKKRVALARALLSNPDLLILDEPTNHLDADSVQWLQDRLQASAATLIFVTHDRYFLDAVSTKILEIDQKRIFMYPGSYHQYLELKESFNKAQEAAKIHTLSRLKVELAWLQKGAKARRSKQKSRIDWVQELARSVQKNNEKKIKIELGNKFLGNRIIELHNGKKSKGEKLLFHNFDYIAKPKDRIGIIGPNGSGKTTLLDVLAGLQNIDSGRYELGGSADIGYFRQEIEDLNPTQSVIGSLKEIAEYIDVGVGRERYLSTRDILNKFGFPPSQQSSLISTLSGGERKRLALCRVLMSNPNVLLLDEPTNDFDLQTLSALEEYLDDFLGVLIIVSHDRYFLDRTVNFIWAFDGRGNIKEYPGNYTNYLEKKEISKHANVSDKDNVKPAKNNWKNNVDNKTPAKKRLTYTEQREFNELEKNIPLLEERKALMEKELAEIDLSDYNKINEKCIDIKNIADEIDKAIFRWCELQDKLE